MAKQDVGDLELIRSNLQTWLAHRLGKTEAFSLGELNFPEASGESSVTLLFDATWSEAGNPCSERFALRMVPKQSEVFESHDLKLQYDLMTVAGQEGVPVPGLVGYEADPDLLGSDFYVMNFVDGLIPPDNPPMAFGSWVTELSEQDRASLWTNGLNTIARIHQIPLDKLPLDSLPAAADDEPPAAHEMRKYARLLELGIRDSADPVIREAWNYLQATVPNSGSRCLCWGDSRPGNMIFSELAPVAVVDWELANIGDPQSDIAWYFWIDHCNSVGLGTDKMSGVPDYDEAYQQWHQLTGLPIDHMAWYELFVVWRFAVIMEKKMIAMTKVDANFADFPNHACPSLQALLDKCRSIAKA